jgi:hypothetical protein
LGNTLSSGEIAGRVLRDGANEGFVELFGQPTAGDFMLNVNTNAAPPALAESFVEAGPAGAFSITVRLLFYDTNELASYVAMPFLETNLRLSDTNRPDVDAYLPPSNYLIDFTTSIRQTASGTRCVVHKRWQGWRWAAVASPASPSPAHFFFDDCRTLSDSDTADAVENPLMEKWCSQIKRLKRVKAQTRAHTVQG